jgi:molybdenum cofactor cytidylyltransferase
MSAGRGALILAAGASQRMGTPKASLPWAGSTLLEYAIAQARLADVGTIVVVLGPATQHLAAPLQSNGVQTAFNPMPETGRSTSIRLGALELHDEYGAILVQSVDQPAPADVLAALFHAVEVDADVAVPTFGGRRGHPVCCAGRVLPDLRAVNEGSEGLRSVVRRHQARLAEVPVNAESVLWNLNDAAAYAAAQAAS